MGSSSTDKTEIFKLYEDGKHRRYSLLFSVNGGAFAIAKLFNESGTDRFLGQLSLSALAYGLAAFTVVMGADIFWFGHRMRQSAGDNRLTAFEGIFGGMGKIVLVLLCALMVAGWLLVATGQQ